MHTIKLDVKSYTSAGVAHANLIVNGQDTGVLYLDEQELKALTSTLDIGAKQSDDVLFEQLEPDTAEFDYDIFED